MKLDILAFGAHPDDVELSCSGVLITEKEFGKKTGVIDLTEGELGTRGTVETRRVEAAASASGRPQWWAVRRLQSLPSSARCGLQDRRAHPS